MFSVYPPFRITVIPLAMRKQDEYGVTHVDMVRSGGFNMVFGRDRTGSLRR